MVRSLCFTFRTTKIFTVVKEAVTLFLAYLDNCGLVFRPVFEFLRNFAMFSDRQNFDHHNLEPHKYVLYGSYGIEHGETVNVSYQNVVSASPYKTRRICNAHGFNCFAGFYPYWLGLYVNFCARVYSNFPLTDRRVARSTCDNWK